MDLAKLYNWSFESSCPYRELQDVSSASSVSEHLLDTIFELFSFSSLRSFAFLSGLPMEREDRLAQVLLGKEPLGVISCRPMIRSRKKFTIYDLKKLKGKRCLTHIHVKSPEEAAAAEKAGVDLMSCSFDSVESQAQLPRLVEAAPNSFFSCATPHGLTSREEAIRIGFKALEMGASSVYCSASPWMIEAMAREGIPVVGHLGLVPRHVTWTNYRAIGKTAEEGKMLYEKMKELESAGAYAAEIECVPHQLASWLCGETSLLLMSLGSGSGCDTQFLFSDDILGDYEERAPRHAKVYRDFSAEFRRLQEERIAAFQEYVADVGGGSFPHSNHLIEMDETELEELKGLMKKS